ncbi:recombinase family protein [Streptomyces sp. ISL-100]|uniref:recombinase family protein n=1 Tax=Streptomyces sp. ISL-100 TaxID=2819173 RepID=UPI001BE7BAC6|nr:recombinase family protein [Streptomyces sp. ISL-100]MBT2398598.1 recombinase family protein [Streptomyces sp. ISL-100]
MNTLRAIETTGLDASWDGIVIPERVRNRTSVALAVGDSLREYVPQRPGCYLRTSFDRHGIEKGIDLQLRDTEQKRINLAWGSFAEVYRENDTGAFKKKRIAKSDGGIDWIVLRPAFRRMLSDLLSGRIDGVIFYDTDRLARQPRDLEDLIDVVEHTMKPAVGVTGDLNLINDADRHMARMLCIMALKASEDTSRRVARNHLADASAGELTGRTPHAWNANGTLRPDRARIARRIYDQFAAGRSITGIARDLNQDNIPSPRGAKWAPPTVKAILTNPRYCGFVSYQGKHRSEISRQRDGWSRVLLGEDGLPVLGTWEPVVSKKLWADAQLELDQRRLAGRQKGLLSNPEGTNYRKYVFTGYLRCGICKAPMSTKRVTGRGHVIYYCPGKGRNACGKVSRRAEPVDQHLEGLINEWARAHAADASTTEEPTSRAEIVDTLRTRISGVAARKRDLIASWATGSESVQGMRPDDYYQALASMNAELDRLEGELADHTSHARHCLTRDYESEWRTGGLEQRRTLVAEIFSAIYVMPSGKGRAPFNPEHIKPQYL